METDEIFLKQAVTEALKAEKTGAPPIGTVIVKANEVIAVGWSSVGPELDLSGHNDINLILLI